MKNKKYIKIIVYTMFVMLSLVLTNITSTNSKFMKNEEYNYQLEMYDLYNGNVELNHIDYNHDLLKNYNDLNKNAEYFYLQINKKGTLEFRENYNVTLNTDIANVNCKIVDNMSNLNSMTPYALLECTDITESFKLTANVNEHISSSDFVNKEFVYKIVNYDFEKENVVANIELLNPTKSEDVSKLHNLYTISRDKAYFYYTVSNLLDDILISTTQTGVEPSCRLSELVTASKINYSAIIECSNVSNDFTLNVVANNNTSKMVSISKEFDYETYDSYFEKEFDIYDGLNFQLNIFKDKSTDKDASDNYITYIKNSFESKYNNNVNANIKANFGEDTHEKKVFVSDYVLGLPKGITISCTTDYTKCDYDLNFNILNNYSRTYNSLLKENKLEFYFVDVDLDNVNSIFNDYMNNFVRSYINNNKMYMINYFKLKNEVVNDSNYETKLDEYINAIMTYIDTNTSGVGVKALMSGTNIDIFESYNGDGVLKGKLNLLSIINSTINSSYIQVPYSSTLNMETVFYEQLAKSNISTTLQSKLYDEDIDSDSLNASMIYKNRVSNESPISFIDYYIYPDNIGGANKYVLFKAFSDGLGTNDAIISLYDVDYNVLSVKFKNEYVSQEIGDRTSSVDLTIQIEGTGENVSKAKEFVRYLYDYFELKTPDNVEVETFITNLGLTDQDFSLILTLNKITNKLS